MSAGGAPDRPNILLLMADQLRRDALGCAGRGDAHTPAIDALARGSVSFTNAVTPAPICVAARMSMITGLRAAATGWASNDPLPGRFPDHPTLMSILAAAGWHTEAIGKMHFGGRRLGLHRQADTCLGGHEVARTAQVGGRRQQRDLVLEILQVDAATHSPPAEASALTVSPSISPPDSRPRHRNRRCEGPPHRRRSATPGSPAVQFG